MFFRNRVVPQHAQLVREHRRLRRGARRTAPQLRAQQRPRAARQVAPARVRRRPAPRPRRSPCRATPGRSLSNRPANRSRPPAARGSCRRPCPAATIGPRRCVGRPSSASMSRAQSPVWQSTIWLVEAIVASTARLPLSQIVKQVGHEQQADRPPRTRRIGQLVRVERIERVERHELDAGRLIDPLGTELGDHLFVGGLIARIAISVRQADQFARLVDERPIDAPGIDAHRHQLAPRFVAGPLGRLAAARRQSRARCR